MHTGAKIIVFQHTDTDSHSRHVDTGWKQAETQRRVSVCVLYWHPHKTSPGNTKSRVEGGGEKERGKEKWELTEYVSA